MINFVRTFKNSKSGASAAEYALIVAVLGGLVVAGATYFGNTLKASLNTSGGVVEAANTPSTEVATKNVTTTP